MDRATSSNAPKPKATAKPGPKAKAIAKPRANTPRKRGFPGGSESCPMDISDGGDSDDDSDATVATRYSTRRKTPSRALVASVESNPKKTKYDPQDPSLRNQSVSPAQTRSAPYLAGKQQDCLPAESNSESNSSIHNQIPPSRRRENFSESYPSPENSSPRTSPPSGVVNQDNLQEATETHVKGVKPTTPAKSSLPDHERYRTMNSKLKIRHFVITLRQGVPTSIYWRSPQLQDKTLERVFDEVAYRTSKSDIQSIEFQLVCEFRCLKYGIRREDTEVFEEMKVAFRRTIKEGKKQEITNFKILLEVDQGEPEDEIDAGAVSDETDVEF